MVCIFIAVGGLVVSKFDCEVIGQGSISVLLDKELYGCRLEMVSRYKHEGFSNNWFAAGRASGGKIPTCHIFV